jgi:hypothetical protein
MIRRGNTQFTEYDQIPGIGSFSGFHLLKFIKYYLYFTYDANIKNTGVSPDVFIGRGLTHYDKYFGYVGGYT